MPERPDGRWEGIDVTPPTSKIKEYVRPNPLKRRFDYTVKRIEMLIQRLDEATDHFSERDKSIFARIVNAHSGSDMPRANVFSCELAEIRVMEKMIIYARLALEQIALRMSICSELYNVVTMLSPATDVLRAVRNVVSAILPEAATELGHIEDLLSGMIADACKRNSLKIDFQKASEDAQKILHEAAMVADQKAKERFPASPGRTSQDPEDFQQSEESTPRG
jgi:division protein CdvB (Snf7/Vps24/ESCRT-III family)